MGILDPKPISAAAIAAQVANPASVIGSQLTDTYGPDAQAASAPMKAAIRAQDATATNRLFVVLGDSHTDSNHLYYAQFDSYHLWAAAYSQGRMRIVNNAGIAGQTSTQILARAQTDVIAWLPNGGTCLVMWGTNDIGQGVPFATTQANTRALVAQLKPAGIVPVFVTIPPRGSGATPATADQIMQTARLNAWLMEYCDSVGVRCIDATTAFTDPATGQWLTNQSMNDGVHHLPRAHRAAGKIVYDALASYLAPGALLGPSSNISTFNLMPNGLFLNSSGGVPTGWTRDAAKVTTSVGAVTGIRGNALTITGATPGVTTYVEAPVITTGFSVGDRIRLSYKYKAARMEDNGRAYLVGLRKLPTYNWESQTVIEGDAADVVTIVHEFTVTTGATGLAFQIGTDYNGAGLADAATSASFGELMVRNLTAGGLLAP